MYFFLILINVHMAVVLTGICFNPGLLVVNLKVLLPFSKSTGREETDFSLLLFSFYLCRIKGYILLGYYKHLASERLTPTRAASVYSQIVF